MSENIIHAGIDIGATNIKYGLVDSGGSVLYKKQRPTLAVKGAEPLLHLVTNISEELLYHAAEDDLEVRWLGVGTPGAVDNVSGEVIGPSPNIKGWQGMAIGRRLKERLNLPVYVENDVNCAALAEYRYGAAAGHNSAICVAIGTGIGAGIMLNGELWRGGNHTAGEIGHLTIDRNGPKCKCGSTGCLEAFCASGPIIERAKSKLVKELTPVFDSILDGNLDELNIKKLFAAVKKGDRIALEVITETAELLALGLAGVVNLLNPDVVVIGGGVAEGGGGFVDAVSVALRKRAFEPASDKLRITRATLGNSAGFIGASILGQIR